MAKVGRPKIENPKINKISVRLSDEEHEKLIEFAKEHSMTKAEVFKKGLEKCSPYTATRIRMF